MDMYEMMTTLLDTATDEGFLPVPPDVVQGRQKNPSHPRLVDARQRSSSRTSSRTSSSTNSRTSSSAVLRPCSAPPDPVDAIHPEAKLALHQAVQEPPAASERPRPEKHAERDGNPPELRRLRGGVGGVG